MGTIAAYVLGEKKVEIKEAIVEKIIYNEEKCDQLRLELQNKENEYLQVTKQCEQLKNPSAID